MVLRLGACAPGQPPSGQSTAPNPAAALGLLSGAVLPQTRLLTSTGLFPLPFNATQAKREGLAASGLRPRGLSVPGCFLP